jgi:hypothetical protein
MKGLKGSPWDIIDEGTSSFWSVSWISPMSADDDIVLVLGVTFVNGKMLVIVVRVPEMVWEVQDRKQNPQKVGFLSPISVLHLLSYS